MAKRRKWTAEKVKEVWLAEYYIGNDMSDKCLMKRDCGLRFAVIKYLGNGSYKKGVETMGIPYGNIARKMRGRWTKETINTEIHKLIDAGNKLNAKHIEQTDKALYLACLRVYGSYKAAIEAHGLNYIEIMKKKPDGTYTTIDNCIDAVKQIKNNNEPLNREYIHNNYHGLLSAICRVRNIAWDDFLTDYCGEPRGAHRRDKNNGAYYGYKFENLGYKYFKTAGCTFEDNKTFYIEDDYRNVLRPDMKLLSWSPEVGDSLNIKERQRVFVDFKLGGNTSGTDDSIKKYLPHCDKVVIVFGAQDHKPPEELLGGRALKVGIMDLLLLTLPSGPELVALQEAALSIEWDTWEKDKALA